MAADTPSTTHGTFVVEETLPQPPERVFQAFADRTTKGTWFAMPGEVMRGEHEFDFRVGGHEERTGGVPGRSVYTYRLTFHDIVPDRRIVSTYEMYRGDVRISVSLTTVELTPDGDGTRLVLTEHGVYLDGHDTAGFREGGVRTMVGGIAAALDRPGA